jgi:hypothetical protein
MGTHAGVDYEIKDDKAAEMSSAVATKTTFMQSSIFNEQVFEYVDKINASSVTDLLAAVVKK